MESLIETFHVDVKLLLAQIINFAVAFVVLYFFGLKPLFKAMRERSEKIAKSLADGRAVEEKLAQTKEDYKKEMARAKREAGELLVKVGAEAEEGRKELLDKAKEEIGQIVNKEKEKIAQEKARVAAEIRSEVADLVVAATEKVLGDKNKTNSDKEAIKNIVD